MRRNKNPEAHDDKARCLEIAERTSACAAVGARECKSRLRNLGRLIRIAMIACLALLFLGTAGHAGFKLVDADGNEKIDLGFRLQVLALASDSDFLTGGTTDSFEDFRLRRGGFRLKGTLNEHFSMFLQTDFADGQTIQMIDAYIHLQKDARLQVFVGQHLVPSSRQTTTSDGTLLAMDRPGSSYKALTWGGQTLTTFDMVFYNDGSAGLTRDPSRVRDVGLTVFGVNDFSDWSHLKYYFGVYNGLSAYGTDEERYTGRLQLNFGDSEPGYYSAATYLGKKRTLAVGASYDVQADVDSSNTLTDYAYWSLDFFAEQPIGTGSLTLEAAFHDLDLNGANSQSEGNGFYAQAGYLINKTKWQPWALYEDWAADAAGGVGSYNLWRAGISYFMEGHNANFKVGYERFSADANISQSNEDTISSIVFGFYTTY